MIETWLSTTASTSSSKVWQRPMVMYPVELSSTSSGRTTPRGFCSAKAHEAASIIVQLDVRLADVLAVDDDDIAVIVVFGLHPAADRFSKPIPQHDCLPGGFELLSQNVVLGLEILRIQPSRCPRPAELRRVARLVREVEPVQPQLGQQQRLGFGVESLRTFLCFADLISILCFNSRAIKKSVCGTRVVRDKMWLYC